MAELVKTDSFESFLVEHGFITKALYDKLKEQSNTSGKSVVDIINGEKILSQETLAQAKGAFLNIPYISFAEKKISPEIMNLLPEDTYKFYHFFAFENQNNNLKVAITDPTNIQALEALEFVSEKKGFSIQLYVTDEQSFQKIMREHDNIDKLVGEALADIEEKEKQERAKKVVKKEATDLSKLQATIQDAPISKIVDVILTTAIEGGASDIHIEPQEGKVRVRYRIDGQLHSVLILPPNVENAVVSKIKILSNLKIDESRLPQDGRFHYETETKQVDLRVSILPNVNGEKIVMRILDKSTKVPTLEQLGFRGRSLTWTQENIKKSHGIFLITGPTGSGKSTTLYALLSMINSTAVNIVTLEDPVEYFMPGVNQSQINPEIGLTFAAGLRSILRQDPNVIMVGEIRDKETAELAVHAALTGHLVFSTLHTNSSIGAIPRLLDMGIEPFLLAASINAIGAQRLVRKICVDCKKEMEVTDEIKKEVIESLKGVRAEELESVDLKNIHMYYGEGCEKCGKTGYKGRVAIIELFPVTGTMQDMVVSKVSPQHIFEEASKIGMITMRQDGIIKVLLGETTYEEVIRVTSE
jgi:type IV pilus assembly protein PilB